MSQAIGVTYADQEHPFYTLLSFTNSYSLSQKERQLVTVTVKKICLLRQWLRVSPTLSEMC